ncbi:MAG TPA: RNA polymerase sigma factor [Gemmatimonadaceae bacterium]|nr:RNA polymerase sigma factor [Gemmatimonadaceae bacterium]
MSSATPAPGDPADSALIARWKTGDERAATILVERHAPAVARYIASLGVREDVEDLVQDAFIRAFGALDGFRGESSLRTWLCTIARNIVRDRARTLKFERHAVEVEEDHAVTADDPFETTVADEMEERVLAAMERLSPMQRQVFTLRVADGMAYREIAEVVGSTEGAARVHYHNAMKAIKESLND